MSVGYLTIAIALFLLADGLLLVTDRRGLVDRLVPLRFGELARRYLGAGVYFLFAGFIFTVLVID